MTTKARYRYWSLGGEPLDIDLYPWQVSTLVSWGLAVVKLCTHCAGTMSGPPDENTWTYLGIPEPGHLPPCEHCTGDDGYPTGLEADGASRHGEPIVDEWKPPTEMPISDELNDPTYREAHLADLEHMTETIANHLSERIQKEYGDDYAVNIDTTDLARTAVGAAIPIENPYKGNSLYTELAHAGDLTAVYDQALEHDYHDDNHRCGNPLLGAGIAITLTATAAIIIYIAWRAL